MGMIICQHHGRTAIELVCTHVSDALDSGLELPRCERLDVGEPVSLLVCVDCAPSVGAAVGDGELMELAETCRPVCSLCLRDRR